LELAVSWLYKHDSGLRLPYQDHLSALIHEPTFRQTVGDAVFNKARVIKDLGNLAVHSQRPVRQFDALTATKELFHLCYWLAHTYSTGAKPAAGLTFDPASVPKPAAAPTPAPVSAQTVDQHSDWNGNSVSATRSCRRCWPTGRRWTQNWCYGFVR
jgi:type I restriction enzyme R subunit